MKLFPLTIAVICFVTFPFGNVVSQTGRPELKLLSSKKIDPILKYVDYDGELTFELSNNSDKDFLLFGRTVHGTFDPTGRSFSVDPKTNTVEFFDFREKPIFKGSSMAGYMETTVIKPGQKLVYKDYIKFTSACFSMQFGVWIKYSKRGKPEVVRTKDLINLGPPECEQKATSF